MAWELACSTWPTSPSPPAGPAPCGSLSWCPCSWWWGFAWIRRLEVGPGCRRGGMKKESNRAVAFLQDRTTQDTAVPAGAH